MKVKVLQEFRDKNDRSKRFTIGEVVDFEQERAEDIIARGLGEKFSRKQKVENDN